MGIEEMDSFKKEFFAACERSVEEGAMVLLAAAVAFANAEKKGLSLPEKEKLPVNHLEKVFQRTVDRIEEKTARNVTEAINMAKTTFGPIFATGSP